MAAGIILWSIISNTIQKSEKKIDVGFATLDLQIVKNSVLINDSKLELTISRGKDSANPVMIKANIFGESETAVYSIQNVPSSFENKDYVFNVTGLGNIREVLIYPISEKGNFGIGKREQISGNEPGNVNQNTPAINPDVGTEEQCIPRWDCLEWNACHINYNLDMLIAGNVTIEGIQTRQCNDLKNCLFDSIETKQCDSKIEVILNKVLICNSSYLEVYDKNYTLISRMNLNEGKLDIQFIFDNSNTDYPNCYNRVQDCNETGIDCGGNCADC
jgi:hypothetical protein